jgi:hypothetical protein
MTATSLGGFLIAILLAAPGIASTVNVTINGYGEGGSACNGPYAPEQSFGSGNLTGTTHLTYSGSGVGLEDGAPPNCTPSPIIGHFSASGLAEQGLLQASAHTDGDAEMNFGFANITVGFQDTVTSISGGTYLFTFGLSTAWSVLPVCDGGGGGGVSTYVVYNTTFSTGNTFARVSWNQSDCQPNAPVSVYGAYTQINPYEVVVPVTMSAGGSFLISSTLQAFAGIPTYNTSSSSVDTGTLEIAGVNGATFSTASGSSYAAALPEPAGWAVTALGFVILLARRGSAEDRKNVGSSGSAAD